MRLEKVLIGYPAVFCCFFIIWVGVLTEIYQAHRNIESYHLSLHFIWLFFFHFLKQIKYINPDFFHTAELSFIIWNIAFCKLTVTQILSFHVCCFFWFWVILFRLLSDFLHFSTQTFTAGSGHSIINLLPQFIPTNYDFV